MDYFEKKEKMWTLKRGDRVKLTNGEIAEFQSLKKKNFVARMNDKLYSIPIEMFVELVEKAEKIDTTNEIMTLKSGELFYIIKNERAIIFKFKFIKGDTIHCINPVNNGDSSMPMSLYTGKVSDL